jgi:hypothetical protein
MSARLHVRRPSGAVRVFLATHVEIDHGLVTAIGRWKGRLDRPARKYIWSASQVLEIRGEVVA